MDRTRPAGLRRSQRAGLRVAGAGLLAATGGIHLDLYLTGYRSIPVIGWLFLLQVIAAFGLALAVLASGSRLAAAAGAGFALSTLGGYLLSVWIGLFGFKEVRTTAGIVAGVVEVAAFAVLAVLAAVPRCFPPAVRGGGPAGRAASQVAGGHPWRSRSGRWPVLHCAGPAGGRRGGSRRAGTSERGGRTEGRIDRGRERSGQCQGLHAVLVRPGHAPPGRTATGRARPTGPRCRDRQRPARASPAGWARSSGRTAQSRPPTTGIRCTPTWVTRPRARPTATGST